MLFTSFRLPLTESRVELLDLTTGEESWAVIPQSVIRFNTDKGSKFWSERTLRKIKR